MEMTGIQEQIINGAAPAVTKAAMNDWVGNNEGGSAQWVKSCEFAAQGAVLVGACMYNTMSPLDAMSVTFVADNTCQSGVKPMATNPPVLRLCSALPLRVQIASSNERPPPAPPARAVRTAPSS